MVSKRRVPHSIIEKIRREKINASLLELQNLLPNCSRDDKLQKLDILTEAVKFIREHIPKKPAKSRIMSIQNILS
jgi:hypothetical protein